MNSKMTTCKACNQEMAKNAKACPHCGAKNKKPFYTKWWFWVIISIFLIGVIAGNNDSDVNNDPTSIENTTPIENTITTQQNKQNNVSTNEKLNVFNLFCVNRLLISSP